MQHQGFTGVSERLSWKLSISREGPPSATPTWKEVTDRRGQEKKKKENYWAPLTALLCNGERERGRMLAFPVIQSDVASPLGNSYSVQSTILGRE